MQVIQIRHLGCHQEVCCSRWPNDGQQLDHTNRPKETGYQRRDAYGPLQGRRPIMSQSATPTRRCHCHFPRRTRASPVLLPSGSSIRTAARCSAVHARRAEARRRVAGGQTVRRHPRTTIRRPKVFRGS